MKFLFLFTTLLITHVSFGQDEKAEEIGLDLNGVLELFSKSNDLEDFEAKLNDESNHVNNLDLNKDGSIDYIRVEEKVKGSTHLILLNALVSKKEEQTVATIDLEQNSNGTVSCQVVGEASLFGPDYIVEANASENAAIQSKSADANAPASSTVNVVVNDWPVVRHIYRPGYAPYVSPFRWGVYPPRWNPWRPVPLATYRVRVAPFRTPYWRFASARRSVVARNLHVAHVRRSRFYPAPRPAGRPARRR